MQEAILDALRGGDAATALTTAREMVAAHPQDPTAHRLLAAALRLGGEQTAALEAIDAAIALAPEDANLHMQRAGLLFDGRQVTEAEAALAHSLGLDPNQFNAYIIQGQLALARGDLDEAQRLTRTAARIAPRHPNVASLEGMLALRRGDMEQALKVLGEASRAAPDEPQLRHAFGLALMQAGHHAFAEQAFRGLLERLPESMPVRLHLTAALRHQGRFEEAADLLEPLLERESSPALQRLVGEMQLDAGRNERALELLRNAFQAQPQDRRSVLAVVEAWRRLQATDEARNTLDAALAEHPTVAHLWQARLLFEPFAGDEARAVVARWLQAMPGFVPALEAMIAIHRRAGETEQAEALVDRILEVQPGHAGAELHRIEQLLQREPAAAVARVEELLSKVVDDAGRRELRRIRGRTLDVAGRHADAVEAWASLHAEVVSQRLPLPPPSEPRAADAWPEPAERDPTAASQLLLWGAPGSMIERVAHAARLAGLPLLSDRLTPQPPNDLFQRYDSIPPLADGSADAAAMVARWREQLSARGARTNTVIDWLPFWDNAYLAALRPHLPEAALLIVIRDPRDMLLNWLAYGSPASFAFESPQVAAQWLARVLDQVADLNEQNLFPHQLVKLDSIVDDAGAMTRLLAYTVQKQLPAPGTIGFGPGLPSGHWQHYREALADAFAELADVARRLGYPEA